MKILISVTRVIFHTVRPIITGKKKKKSNCKPPPIGPFRPDHYVIGYRIKRYKTKKKLNIFHKCYSHAAKRAMAAARLNAESGTVSNARGR